MKFIDLFSGIGGFRLGLELAGHECVGHCEVDKFADRSYRAMYSCEGEWFINDVRKINPKEMPEFELLCAGFPCQSFSIAGKRRGFEDIRGTMFFEIARLVNERKPPLLLLENVKGLLSHDQGRTFKTILSTLYELGYDAEWQLLNSKDFGVPQNRERVFIIAHIRGRSFTKIFPIISCNPKTLKQLIGGKQGQRVYSIDGLSTTLTSHGGGQGAKTGLYFVDLNLKPQVTENARCIKARYNSGITNKAADNSGVLVIPRAVLTPERLKKRQNGRRFKNENEPMFTLTTQDRHGILLGGAIRKLTPLECFRLQGFPDEFYYKAQSVNSDSQLYKQAGNSVTVSIVYEIGTRLRVE